jgi:type 1 glutamine amidotransferase
MSEALGKQRINCVLVAAGKYHDIDFARLELLKLLAEDDRVRVRVFEDYSNLEAIRAADFLVTYTCDVVPSVEQQEALREWVIGGGRWYALHGTNSILRFLENGKVDAPNWAPLFMETLGSRFLSHPPIAPYRVRVTAPGHPLVQGVEPFDSDDELYLSEYQPGLEVLLAADFGGETQGFVHDKWPQGEHPVFYIRPLGAGAVLYLTLGHCRGHYDMQPRMPYWPSVERGSWELPVFYDLLRRGLAWAKPPREAAAAAE